RSPERRTAGRRAPACARAPLSLIIPPIHAASGSLRLRLRLLGPRTSLTDKSTVSHRPRFLVLTTDAHPAERLELNGVDVLRADSWPGALETLRREPYDAILADLASPGLLDSLRTFARAERILEVVPDGVAVVDFDLKIRWANPTFRSWCIGEPVG